LTSRKEKRVPSRRERVPNTIDITRITVVRAMLMQRIERMVCIQLGFAVQGLQGGQFLDMIVIVVWKKRDSM
jgi:hypothetical protein